MSILDLTQMIESDPPQYLLFKEYSRAIKSFLEKVVYLKRFSKDKQPKIYYSTPRRAWAKYVSPIINGFSDTPIITFNLLDPEPIFAQNTFASLRTEHETDSNKYSYHYGPTIWKLPYKITIWAATMDDMDTLLYQILAYSVPPKCWATMVNGAWGEIVFQSTSIEDELEPGDAKDKVIRRGVSVFIRRAYLPRESWDVGKINEIHLQIETELNEEIMEIEEND